MLKQSYKYVPVKVVHCVCYMLHVVMTDVGIKSTKLDQCLCITVFVLLILFYFAADV
jgi:hypothetical protein